MTVCSMNLYANRRIANSAGSTVTLGATDGQCVFLFCRIGID